MTNLLRQGISMVIGGLVVGVLFLATGVYAQLAPADTAAPAAANAPMMVDATLNVDAQIQYQGQLLDPNTGQPYPAGKVVAMIFQVVDANNNVLWTQNKPSVTLFQGGLLSVVLGGSGFEFDDRVFGTDEPRFLRVTVDNQILQPLQPITAVPWAINARRFDGLKTRDFVRFGTDGIIAMGVIDGSPNNFGFTGAKYPDGLSVNRDGTGIYSIRIPGVDYNVNNYVTLVTPAVNPQCTSPSVPGTGSKDGRLEITLYARGNPSVPVDCKFHFMTLEAP